MKADVSLSAPGHPQWLPLLLESEGDVDVDVDVDVIETRAGRALSVRYRPVKALDGLRVVDEHRVVLWPRRDAEMTLELSLYTTDLVEGGWPPNRCSSSPTASIGRWSDPGRSVRRASHRCRSVAWTFPGRR